MAGLSGVDQRLREAALEALNAPKADAASDPAWARMRELGTELWLDTGNLEEASALWTREMSALTTNNTLANQVVQTGVLDDVVKNAIKELIDAEPSLSEEAMIMELGFVVNCHVALRLVRAFGALVSVELHPSVGYDVDRSVHYAERYYAICPERFIIKIPLTPEGYCSVARTRAKGIPVNYTLGFSARQNYLAGMISNPSYVNVFLGRLNAVVSDNKLGDGKNVGERVTLASQAAIRELRGQGLCETKQIAASMRSASQVHDLAGVDVFTMPTKVAKEFAASKPDAASLTSRLDEKYAVSFEPAVDTARIEALWEIDDNVIALAKELRSRGAERLSGDDLRDADRDHGTGLFHSFSSAESVDIRTQGKIPNMARWLGEKVALDDLMSQSALQSFIVDQAALDDHLRALTRSK